MRLHQLPLLLSLSALGCMGIDGTGDVDGADQAAISLTAELRDGRVSLAVRNDGDTPFEIGCDQGFCWDPPMLRVEAQQSDGSWVRREPDLGYEPDRDVAREVWPGQSSHLTDVSPWQPGLYRVVLRVETSDGPVDVARELVVVGWSEAHRSRGVALLEEADVAECASVARRIHETLLANVEPDDALTLLDAAADDEARRRSTLTAMMARGTFVPELAEEVRVMSMADVRRFANPLSESSADTQKPLRAAVAARLFEPVANLSSPLDHDHLLLLESFKDDWPPHAPDALSIRLARGSEQGEDLARFIDLLAYTPYGFLEADADEVLAALGERCAGAPAGSTLEQSCERAIDRFSGEGLGFMRGWSTSHCGGAVFLSDGTCRELLDALVALVDEAGDPEVHVLGASTFAVEPS